VSFLIASARKLLSSSILRGTNLSGADLSEAVLRGVDLRNTKNLTIAQLSEVKSLFKTRLDTNLENEARDKYPHLFEEPKEEK